MLNAPQAAEWLLDGEAIPVLDIPVLDIPAGLGPGRGRPLGEAILALLQTGWLQILLCLAAAVPLLWPQMPPLTDLGGHLGRFAVQIDAGRAHGGAAILRQWYSFHWRVIPNLGTDLLMQVLAPLMGLEPALKAIVIGIVLIQAAGFLALAKTVHGQVPPTTLLALPLVYGYPFQFGFLNFTLAAALGTWALALWIHLQDRASSPRRWLIFVPIAGALWLCHFAGFALFCVFAAGAELAVWRDRGLGWRDAGWRCVAPLSCLLVPCLLFAFWPRTAGSPDATTGWFDIIAKLGMIVMAMRDRWGVWDVASALLLVAMIGWTWRSRRFTLHAGLALGAILAAAAFVIVPKHVGGTSFVDMRLVPMILAVALIAVRPRDDAPRRIIEALAVGGLLFAGARFAGNGISMALGGRQFAQDLAVLDSLPRDAQLVTLTLKPCGVSDPWHRDRRTHLAGYALARRHDFANDQWLTAGGQLLQVHNAAAAPFIGDPSQTANPTDCRGKPGVFGQVATIPSAVPYLWMIDNGLVRDFAGWTAIRRSPGSVLYARDQQAGGGTV